MYGHRQWSPLWYLFQNFEINHSNLWRFEPLGLSRYVRSYLLFKIPRLIELWFKKISRQLDPIPKTSFLHGWIRPIDLKRILIIQSLNCPWINLINVRCQEYDVRCWPKTRKIFDRLSFIQRKNVHQRSRWINVECLKQELILFRWMDSK